MASYIKGAAIENAVEYRLYRKTDESQHSLVMRTPCGKNTTIFSKRLHIGDDGELYYDESDERDLCTDHIHVDDLVDDETTGACVGLYPNLSKPYWSSAAFYKAISFEPEDFCVAYTFNDLASQGMGFDAANIRWCAEQVGAKYVIFYSRLDDNGALPWVNATKEIMFRLDDYRLPQGKNLLVVKAIAPTEGVDTDGDGKIDIKYTDSKFGGDASGAPIEYQGATS